MFKLAINLNILIILTKIWGFAWSVIIEKLYLLLISANVK